MLDYRDLLYFIICLLFMMQVFHNGGFADYNIFPVGVPVFFLFIFSIFYIFKGPAHGSSGSVGASCVGPGRTLVRAVLINCALYFSAGLFSSCIQISLIEMLKHLSGVLLFFMLYSLIKTKADFKIFLKTLLAFVQVYIILALAYYFYAKANGVALTGVCYTLYYPYYHATFALAFIPAAIYFYLVSEGGQVANYFFFLITLMLSVILTSSRIAQISLALSFFIMCAAAFYIPRHRKKTVILLAALLVVSAAGFLYATDAFHRIVQSFDASESFDAFDHSGRFNIYRAALKTASEYPWFGVGPGLSALFIVEHRLTSGFLNDCHNLALNVLCEVQRNRGAAWAAFWLICFLLLAKNIYRLYKKRKEDIGAAERSVTEDSALIMLFSLTALIVLHIQGFSMPHTYMGALIILEYFLLAFAAVALDLASVEPPCDDVCADETLFSFDRRQFLHLTLFSFLFFFMLSFVLFSGVPDAFAYWTVGMTFLFPLAYIGVKKPLPLKVLPGRFPADNFKAISAAALIFIIYCSVCLYKAGVYSHGGFGEADSGAHAPAGEQFTKSLESFVTMPAVLGLASSSLYCGEYDKALKLSEFYNKKLPFELLGLHNLAASLVKCGMHQKASEVLKKYSDYIPADYGGAFYGAFLMDSPASAAEGIERFAGACIETPEFLRTAFFVKRIVNDEDNLKKFLACFQQKAESNAFVQSGKYSSYIASSLSQATIFLFLSGAIDARAFLDGCWIPQKFGEINRLKAAAELKNISAAADFFSSKRFISYYTGANTGSLARFLHALKREPPVFRPPYIHMGLKRLMSKNTLYDVYGLRNHLLMPPLSFACAYNLLLGDAAYRRYFLKMYLRGL